MENINITLEEPGISNVDSVLTGPQGPQGEPGEPGRDGVSPTITVGTVTTVSSSSPATVTNVGSESNVILDFNIPQGVPGPAGADGSNGADGTDGLNATIAIGSTTTLDPDQTAYVTNSGTATNAILNFGIPRGAEGDTSDVLSVPTIVDSLPAVGDPTVFYFVPITNTPTVVTSDSITFTITTDYVGRTSQFDINGNLVQATVPGTPEPLQGVITININGTDYAVDISSIEYLAKVTTHQDKIYNVGNDFYIRREVGYINSYTNEDLTGLDYVCTSGTLTIGDEVYYELDTPTDTQITDESLINQLRIVKNTIYPDGSNSISTTANVTAELTVGYYEIDPHHQYNKYVYMIETSDYEQIG